MKAVCAYFSGNSFDNKKGTVVQISELYISRIWRDSKELDISDLSQETIREMVKVGDTIEDNYCHGQYEAIVD